MKTLGLIGLIPIEESSKSSGKQLYLHNVSIVLGNINISFTAINDSQDDLTEYANLKKYLDNHGYKDYLNDNPRYQILPVAGYNLSGSTPYMIYGILSGYDIDRIEFKGYTFAGTNRNISDYITETTTFTSHRDVVTAL